MTRLVLALALLGSAVAFSPALSAVRTSRVVARMSDAAAMPAPAEGAAEAAADDAEEEAPPPAPVAPRMSRALPFMEWPEALDGTLAGDFGFDPFGFTNLKSVKWLREAELKHGRMCMLATTGFVAVDLGMRFPWPWLEDYGPLSSVQAHDAGVESGSLAQVFLWAVAVELFSTAGVMQMLNGETDREPGDFCLDPLNFCKDAATTADLKLKEITHSRLAMLAFGGMVTQAVLVEGKGFPYFY